MHKYAKRMLTCALQIYRLIISMTSIRQTLTNKQNNELDIKHLYIN